MDLTGVITGSIAILSLFVGLPMVVFPFINKFKENSDKNKIEKLKYQKEILELEIQKEKIALLNLKEENEKYDKIIMLEGKGSDI